MTDQPDPYLENVHLGTPLSIGSETLPEDAQIWTIRVAERRTDRPFENDPKIVLHFVEHPDARWALNTTNRKRISALYGDNAYKWPGYRILIYRVMTQFGNRPRLGVRVWDPDQLPPEPVVDLQGNRVEIAPPQGAQDAAH